MKKVWIDGYEANVPQRLGSSQVAFELLRNIEKYDRNNDYTVLLPSQPLGDLPKERSGFAYRILKPGKLWTRIALPMALFLSKIKPDVFFTPTHYIPRFAPSQVKRVVTIFDLSYLHFPEMFQTKDLYQLTNWSKFSITNANHIVTISKSTKKDLIKNYSLSSDKITVVYPGFDAKVFKPVKNLRQIRRIQNRYGIKGNYIIYIGTIQPRKNLVRLIEAFSRLHPEGEQARHLPGAQLQLVVVGKTTGLGRQAWMFEDILNAPAKLGIENQVIFTGFVPTEELPYLISGAVAYVLPSLWEGFGIPVVESMACGTPAVVSNVSSLPEVVGKAGLLVDPYSVDQIEQAIRTVVVDKKLRARLSKLSLAQASKFSWRKMAREVIRVLENV